MKQQDIGHQIISARKRLNYTQKELGDRLGVSDKTISKWERGNGYPDISMLIPLCQVLGIEVAQLLGEEDSTKGSSERNLKTLAEYAVLKVKENRERICKITWLIVSLSALLAIGICLLTNYVISGGMDWSVITTAAILYGWLVLTPLLMTTKYPIEKLLVISTLGIFPFLYVLSWYLPITNFFPFSCKIALAADILCGCIYLVWKKCHLNIWFQLAIIIALAGVFSCFVNILTEDNAVIIYFQLMSNILASITCCVIGFYCMKRAGKAKY